MKCVDRNRLFRCIAVIAAMVAGVFFSAPGCVRFGYDLTPEGSDGTSNGSAGTGTNGGAEPTGGTTGNGGTEPSGGIDGNGGAAPNGGTFNSAGASGSDAAGAGGVLNAGASGIAGSPTAGEGGTTGSGGIGTAGTGGAGAASCDASAPLRLYYRNVYVRPTTGDLNYIVKVENRTGSTISLSSLKVRYYFTNEATEPWTTEIYYVDTCCQEMRSGFDSAVHATLHPAETPGAHSYLETTFDPAAGSLLAGDAVQVEVGFYGITDLTQTNDYSYIATASGSQSEWNRCPGATCPAKFDSCTTTLLSNDVLVWGTPP